MKGKTLLGMMFALMLPATLVLAFEAQQMKPITATGKTWYVGPPPSDFAGIQEAINNTSVLDGDIVEVKWKATPYYENVTVNKSLKIRHYSFDAPGFYPTVDGINEKGTVFNVIAPNVEINSLIIQNGYYGILLSNQSATIHNNTVSSNIYGIFLKESYTSTLKENTMNGNSWNFGVDGKTIDHFIHDIDDSNLVDGKPICYWVNHTNEIVPSGAGYVAIVNSTNITADKSILGKNYQGVLVAYSTGVVVKDMKCIFPYVQTQHCIEFVSVTNSIVRNVTVSDNECGVLLRNSRNNSICENKMLSKYGVLSVGIDLDWSDNNIIMDNSVRNDYSSTTGIGVHLSRSISNTIVGNTVSRNQIGIALEWSNRSLIFHNNISNSSSLQAFESSYSFDNDFDNGYEGNYWSDYKGVDDNGDGIGDTFYFIQTNNRDNRPLMESWNSSRIFKRPWKTIMRYTTWQKLYTFSNSTLASFAFDYNLKQISFKATSGYDGFLNVTIPRSWLDGPFTVLRNGINVSYTLTTNPSFSSIYIAWSEKGTHSIKIVGTEVGNIYGDLNGDGKVDICDIVLACTSYGSKEGEPNWNPNANFASPWNRIDILDLVTIAYNYGKTYP